MEGVRRVLYKKGVRRVKERVYEGYKKGVRRVKEGVYEGYKKGVRRVKEGVYDGELHFIYLVPLSPPDVARPMRLGSVRIYLHIY